MLSVKWAQRWRGGRGVDETAMLAWGVMGVVSVVGTALVWYQRNGHIVGSDGRGQQSGHGVDETAMLA